jgi:hypothetical protein
MAAGLGFKDFVTGEVLTAADVDGYLMQGIWVFASAAARDAAVTSPQEGNACYLKDTNQVLTYSGSAWVAVGGGSPLTTKGDLYGFSTVDARIPIGSNNQVLTADSTQALGLKWASPAGGGKVLQVVTATTSTQTTVASTSYTDTSLTATITPTLSTSKILVLVCQQFRKLIDSGAIQGTGINILRGATQIYDGTDQLSWHNFTGVSYIQYDDLFTVTYVDSPATTSSTTYKTQAKVFYTANNGKVVLQDASRVSTITLLEIGA